jgi:hypothetical protein
MEAELPADSLRILRPLAQWLEEGALRIVPEVSEGSALSATPPAEGT